MTEAYIQSTWYIKIGIEPKLEPATNGLCNQR